MLIRTLFLAVLVCVGACSEDESHFLDCGEGVHIEQGDRSYCVYPANLVDDAFVCPEGTLARINIDSGAVCTNVPEVDTVSELPAEVCEILQTQGCMTPTTQFSIDLSSPGLWAEDTTEYGATMYWLRTAPNPDTAYFYGTGAFQAGQLNLELAVKLPEHALQDGVVGVGVITVMDPSYGVSEGELDEAEHGALEAEIRGVSANYAIIFKQDPADYSDETKQLIEDNPEEVEQHWFNQFDIGYSCGRCVHWEEFSDTFTFDRFEPVSCEDIIIDATQSTDVDACNWT